MPATSRHMTKEHEASPLGSHVLHFGKILHFKHRLNEAECFLCVTDMCSFLAPAPVLLFTLQMVLKIGEGHKNNKIPEMCL